MFLSPEPVAKSFDAAVLIVNAIRLLATLVTWERRTLGARVSSKKQVH